METTTSKPWNLSIGFLNLGRGNVAQTTTALEKAAEQMDALPEPAVLFINEADEADAADEHSLISRFFPGWAKRAWETREPILTKALHVLRDQSSRGAKGVARQSPARELHEVLVEVEDGPDVVFIGGHYPAGAHNGTRARAVFVLLMAGYTTMLYRHRKRIRHHRKAGRHVVWAMDVNWRLSFPRLHRLEKTMRRHGPDLVRVIPAKGWRVKRVRDGRVALPVEALHGLEWAVVQFFPRRRRAK